MSPPITPAVAVPAAFRPPPRPPARVRRRRRHGSVAPAHPPRRCRGSYRAQRLPDVPTADASPCAGIDHLAYRGCKGTSAIFDAASVHCLGIGMQCHDCCVLQRCIAHSSGR
ncbi:uncharacterized protein LOC112903353 [Panicum hallii]|uniref:uncharacterized protein LOC112903353 n=1 Tax=Panicum hallii TaxID=206008 RepID=UPI000DF4E658|nr:uncharacterized protein LOC112903353 [Panicum hallii]